MTSIERTAYPRFTRLITARELHMFFTPSEEEQAWSEEAAAQVGERSTGAGAVRSGGRRCG